MVMFASKYRSIHLIWRWLVVLHMLLSCIGLRLSFMLQVLGRVRVAYRISQETSVQLLYRDIVKSCLNKWLTQHNAVKFVLMSMLIIYFMLTSG